MIPLPIHRARVGRIVLAILDQDTEKAEGVVADAVTDDTLPELFDAAIGALVFFLLRVAGDDGAKQWASDWVLHARMTEHPEQQTFDERNKAP